MAQRIRLVIDTGFAGCQHEDFLDLPDDWETMSEEERQKYLDEEASDFLSNNINYSAYVVDDEETSKD